MSSRPRSTVIRLDAYRRRKVPSMDRTLDEVLGRAPIGFLHLDSALHCLKINPWLAAAYGVAVDDAIGRPLRSFAPTVAAAVAEDAKSLLEGGSAVRMVVPVECAGETAFYQHHFMPVPGPEGRVRGIDIFVCNVDAPARVHEQRRSNEFRAREGAKRMPRRSAPLVVPQPAPASTDSAPRDACLLSGTKTPVA